MQQKTALVIGASSGVGRATALALSGAGVRVIGVARGEPGLSAIRNEVGIETIALDASKPAIADVVRERRPDWIVIAGGVRPQMGALDALSWEAFSEAWERDVRATFEIARAAIATPLMPGSSVVVVSSGAAINGSDWSGGYAGAKRMQWLMAGYLQTISDERQLGIRFHAVVPKQLIEGTAIAANASSNYGSRKGMTAADYMKRFEVPLTADKVADAIVRALRGELQGTALEVTGASVEVLQ